MFPFFGREAEVREALTILWKSRFLAVVGRTGSGKSSVALAGVVPEWRARSGGAKSVEYVYMRPGTNPGASMAEARARLEAAAQKPALLVIDQFEELFRSTREVVRTVSSQIDAVLNNPRHYVIITARADFYPDLMELPIWPLIKNNRLEVLPLAYHRRPVGLVDTAFEGSVASLSPNSRWLATGGHRGTVRLWDLDDQSARPPVLRTTLSYNITAITFDDSGRYVFVGDNSGKVHRWLTSVDALAALVCAQSWRNLSNAEWQQYVGDELPYACTCPNLPPGDGAPISVCK